MTLSIRCSKVKPLCKTGSHSRDFGCALRKTSSVQRGFSKRTEESEVCVVNSAYSVILRDVFIASHP